MAKLIIAIIITAALVACLFACVPCEKEDNTACIAEVEDDVCVTVTFSADNADISVFNIVAPVKCAPSPWRILPCKSKSKTSALRV